MSQTALLIPRIPLPRALTPRNQRPPAPTTRLARRRQAILAAQVTHRRATLPATTPEQAAQAAILVPIRTLAPTAVTTAGLTVLAQTAPTEATKSRLRQLSRQYGSRGRRTTGAAAAHAATTVQLTATTNSSSHRACCRKDGYGNHKRMEKVHLG